MFVFCCSLSSSCCLVPLTFSWRFLHSVRSCVWLSLANRLIVGFWFLYLFLVRVIVQSK